MSLAILVLSQERVFSFMRFRVAGRISIPESFASIILPRVDPNRWSVLSCLVSILRAEPHVSYVKHLCEKIESMSNPAGTRIKDVSIITS